MNIKVFVTSAETHKGAPRGTEAKLKSLYELSDKRYLLVETPESADIILIGNMRNNNFYAKVLENPLIKNFTNKCFLLSNYDNCPIILHGLYCSAPKSIFNLGRVRSGSFSFYDSDFMNPFISNHKISASNLNKKYLFSFIGRDSHKARESIFKINFSRQDIFVENSTSFDVFNHELTQSKTKRQKYFYDTMLKSKFSLCPRGLGPSSIRIFESLQLGIAPIIIGDDWLPPTGPKWDTFSILIKEKHIADLEKIVASYESHYQEMGLLAKQAFEAYFSDSQYFNYVVDNCIAINETQLINEKIPWMCRYALINHLKFKHNILKSRKRLMRVSKRLIPS